MKPALATSRSSLSGSPGTTETSALFVVDEAIKTLPYYFSTLTLGTSAIVAQGIQAAAALIVFIPNIVLFILLQRQVMNTMAYSGMK